MPVLSTEECFRILCDMKMPDHIVAHSIQVTRVATLLVSRLEKDISLNLELVRASALLHDITKPKSFASKEDHAETGARLISDMGYREIAQIVRQHVRLDKYFESAKPSEAEVVNYSDKRVLHDKIVPLRERMDYIMKRYAVTEKHRQLIRHFWKKTEELEKRLFDCLPFPPEDLAGLLDDDFNTYLSAYRKIRTTMFQIKV